MDKNPIKQSDIKCNHAMIFKKGSKQPLTLKQVEQYLCYQCHGILFQAMQLSCCGNRLCYDCLSQPQRNNNKYFICPSCREKVGSGPSDEYYAFSDHSCNRDMKTLETVCNTQPIPCKWRGPLLQFKQHCLECDNVEVYCTLGCGENMIRLKLQQHLQYQCMFRKIQCEYCSAQVEFIIYQEHLLNCTKREDSSCPFCKKACESRQKLHEHINGDQCPLALLSCPLREALGCRAQVKPGQLVNHSVLHFKDVVQKNQTDSSDLQKELKEVRSELSAVHETYKQQNKLLEQYERNISMLKQQINDLTIRHSEQIENLTENVSRIGSAPAAKPYGVHTSDLTHFEGNIRSLQNSFDVLARQIDALNVKVEENTETVGTLQTAMDQCTKAITQVNGMVNEVGLKVDILAVRSINGILIWKVNEVEKRIEEAKTGKILSLYSPPFFTSLHGYRMCLRLYLDGDGQGKGTHLSLFLVIMKSDYDDLLTWPFKQKVTLYLLNQQDPYNTKAHIAQAFRPTETSTSFQKPRGPFNTASGFPKFAPVEKLRDRSFVQDDCMYFKVKIDMTDVKAPDYPAY